MNIFKNIDTVKLKGGSQCMSIRDIIEKNGAYSYLCNWHDKMGILQTDTFKEEQLEFCKKKTLPTIKRSK